MTNENIRRILKNSEKQNSLRRTQKLKISDSFNFTEVEDFARFPSEMSIIQSSLRVKFKKGEQRKFLEIVIRNLNCVSLKDILQFGFNLSYSSLKNYYNERRLMRRNLFEQLCYLMKINTSNFMVSYLEEHWGQIKGGKIRHGKKFKKK